MPRLIALALTLTLLACGKTAPPPQQTLRDASVDVRSIAGFIPSRMAGTWHQAASLTPTGTSCGPGHLTVQPQGDRLALQGQLCLGGQLQTINTYATPSGPGRLQLAGRSESWWVIWADWDMRTLVLADPKGSFGVILDRGKISPDRLRAAKEILDFNGYRTTTLH